MKHYLKMIVGDQTRSLKEHVINGFMFIGFLISTLATLGNIILDLSAALILTTIGLMFLFMTFFYLSRFQRRFQLVARIMIFLMIFILSPALWIYNGGSYGGGQYFLLIFGMVIAVLSSGKRRIFYLVIHLGGIGALLMIESYFPEIITRYPSRLSRLVDLIISLWIATGSTWLFFKIYIDSYHQEHQLAEQYRGQINTLSRESAISGVFTKRYLLIRFQEEVNRTRRYQRSFSLVGIQGHSLKGECTMGPQFCLLMMERIISIIKEACGELVLIGEGGQNGLTLLLPERDLDGAVQYARKILDLVRRYPPVLGISLSLNIGVVQWHHHKIEDAFEVLNHRLYLAAERGENQLVFDDHGVYNGGLEAEQTPPQ